MFSKYSSGCAVIGYRNNVVCDNRWQHDQLPGPGQSKSVALRAEMHGYALMGKKVRMAS